MKQKWKEIKERCSEKGEGCLFIYLFVWVGGCCHVKDV